MVLRVVVGDRFRINYLSNDWNKRYGLEDGYYFIGSKIMDF